MFSEKFQTGAFKKMYYYTVLPGFNNPINTFHISVQLKMGFKHVRRTHIEHFLSFVSSVPHVYVVLIFIQFIFGGEERFAVF